MNRLALRPQIILATFVPLIVLALVAAAIAGYALVNIPRDLVLQRQTALAQMASSGVAGDLRGYVRLLQSVAGEMADNAGALPRQQSILAERTRLLGRFSAGTALLDARGTTVAATPGQRAALGLNYAFRPYFQDVRTTLQPAFSTVMQDQPSGLAAVVIAVPVLSRPTPGDAGNAAGDFAGVLVGEFALNQPEWASDLDLLRTSEGGTGYLMDRAGTIIYHPDPHLIGTSVHSNAPLWNMAQQGVARSGVLQAPGSPAMIVSVAPIPGIPWLIAIEEPFDSVLAPVARYRWAAGGLLLLGIGLALAALLATVRRVTHPLATLLAESRRVIAGEAFRPVPAAGPSDVRDLVSVVNQMVLKLDEQSATLRGYAAQVLRSQEEERLRLARDLHDETVQQLVGLARSIELCQQSVAEDPAAARQQLATLQDLAYATAGEVRRFSNSLRPAILEELGLAAALQVISRNLAEQLATAEVRCEIVGLETRLPADLELAAFRIAQEALNNVRKHAGSAAHVSVALVYESWGILLIVEDDGPGFAASESSRFMSEGHLGLAGMVERAQLFGGELKVTSAPGEGATVRLRLQYPPAPPLGDRTNTSMAGQAA